LREIVKALFIGEIAPMRRLTFAFLTALVLALCAPGLDPAWAAEDINAGHVPSLRPIMTTYDVYVGGIHFLTADILFEERNGHYLTHVHGHTAGYLYKLLKWDGIVVAEGRTKGDRFIPQSFINYDSWRNKLKKTEIDFDNKGTITTSFDPAQTIEHPISVADMRGALDPAAALLQMLGHIATEQDCNVSMPVFDGKRRFDLHSSDQGLDYVNEADYGAYTGPARRCDVDFTMIAGEWKDKDKDHRFWEHADGQPARDPFHVWLASPTKSLPELPIRLESTSAWGNIIAHLSAWHYASGDELKAQATESLPQLVKTAN
jgi:hypothetical protein